MIETRPGVSIDESSRWMFEGREVTHPGVLAYFKLNLHRQDGQYFILNTHGQNVEKGVLDSVRGFPLFALSVSFEENSLAFLLDTGERTTIERSNLFTVGSDVLFFFHPVRGTPVRLKSSAMVQVMEAMDEVRGRLIWQEDEPVSVFTGRLF